MFNSWCSGAATIAAFVSATKGEWVWAIPLAFIAILSLIGALIEKREDCWF